VLIAGAMHEVRPVGLGSLRRSARQEITPCVDSLAALKLTFENQCKGGSRPREHPICQADANVSSRREQSGSV
jgi:hypothetical protein